MSGTGKKVAGGVQYVKGKLQRALGKLTGNRSMQARGWGNQAAGGTKYGVGRAQDAVDDVTR
jgi:uncharacterized protein YjbJ (UPF0337 family)